MTPTSLLGFVVLAASLGPGYIYERVAELKRPRTSRSTLVETVEMVVVGAAFSISSALVVLAVAETTGWVRLSGFADHPARYLIRHGIAGVGAVGAVIVLSYLAAGLSALLVYRGQSVRIYPGGSPWHHVFLRSRPTDDSPAFVTASLNDGTEIAGILGAYTLEQSESREIALLRPLAIRLTEASQPELLDEDFVLLRDADVKLVRGHFLPSRSSTAQP